jgi:SGNH hydrolase-like domain, acetyltransferase AlgX
MSRRQFALALAALMQAPAARQQAPLAADRSQRAAAMATLAATLRDELAKSGADTWDHWVRRLEPVRAQWKVVAAGTLKGRNGYIFNKNALNYLVDTNLEAGPENTHPLDTIAAFDAKMKRLGIDFLYVPIPSIEEVYPETFLDAVPPDLTVQPGMRRLMLSLLERDVEVLDLLRPFQAARDGYKLGLKRDDHWNNVQIELAASLVAERLRRYAFVQAAAAEAKRYTTKAIAIGGDRGVDAMRQVIAPSGKLYEDVERSPVLVVGDSKLQIYEYQNENLTRTGEHAGFTAHLARHLGLPVSLEAQGGFVLAQLNREPELFAGRRVVIFVGAAWVLSYLPWAAIAE